MYKHVRAIAAALCLCLALSLCACGKKLEAVTSPAAPAPETVTAQPSSPAESPAPAAPAETDAPVQETAQPQTGEAPSQNTMAVTSPVKEGESLSLTDSQQYALNTFLSFFAEARFKSYTNFDYDFVSLVSFMRHYVKMNDFNSVVYKQLADGISYETVSYDDANRVFLRFFGRCAGEDAAKGYVDAGYSGDVLYGMFLDGCYYFPAASGESFNRFAVADSVYPIAGTQGGYTVYFTVYELDIMRYLDDNGIKPDYYQLSSAEAAEAEELTAVEQCCAVVYDYNDSGSSTYQIAYYEILGSIY